ncbi:hypothetical protein J2Y45_000781 [Dyadobacter sp. BE34]|uniref:Collagen-like protein n=1 Tax=Dyadobacter fermentans TaxID=94254 RepID=A0ABU1QQU9_9BACT|nr:MULTISPECIES: hypothetical protein [Dyadobacter]MDR6803511.1 hypothetical protein [Dyadobacter fermentans]MDR7041252.1 hypothetical protein [Dyadobacter sp. BE242]MDR7195655.1 hypothetical protein [Dyadobacter sp. BE34]MDR7213800.1 hypothetical protein [Dyadobacter sp. BE31]MDR7261062.1 hypothetical protein [Dyadobacter sp. BE32]
MLKRLIFFASVVLIGMSLVNCDGEKGDVGPAGKDGATGPAGAQGPKGDTGVAGKDALGARIITTGALKTEADGGYSFGVSNLTPADTAMLTDAGVFVYIKSQNYWWSIPGPVGFASGDTTTFHFRYALRNGRTFFVQIKPVSWTDGTPTAPVRDLESVRVIFVPTEKFRRSAAIDWKDYNAVVKALNLNESDAIQAD